MFHNHIVLQLMLIKEDSNPGLLHLVIILVEMALALLHLDSVMGMVVCLRVHLLDTHRDLVLMVALLLVHLRAQVLVVLLLAHRREVVVRLTVPHLVEVVPLRVHLLVLVLAVLL